MTPRDFIANFDTIAEAPNGIVRLREFVLQLAVRGKFVAHLRFMRICHLRPLKRP